MNPHGKIKRGRLARWILPVILLGAGIGLLGNQTWVRAKAVLASVLIERAFAAHIEDGGVHTPWSWADIHPIARIEAADGKVSRIVLSGASGGSLAFGPGHIDGTAPPNAAGNCVIAGHRDTYFRFLKDLQQGDKIALTSKDGTLVYRVSNLAIVEQTDTSVLEPTSDTQLTLITCYPFDGLVSSKWRYVVFCEPL
jgi:sortase A